MTEGENKVTEEQDIKPLPALVYEHTVNGKRVTLKRRLPGKDARGLAELINRVGEVVNDPLMLVPLGLALIESWEFEGSPQEATSYDELDVFDELYPLASVLIGYYTARTNRMATVKN